MDHPAEEVAPNAGHLIESLRDFGYTLQSALADLIDNSLTADAANVEVIVHAEKSNSYIAVIDNGMGMDADTGTSDGAANLIGVGEYDQLLGNAPPSFNILTCTNSAEDGDFRVKIANQIGFQVTHGSRLVLVVKKHATILKNLTRWLRAQNIADSTTAAGNRIPMPALVIDDEADHASVNTSDDPESDPSRINALIRKLLLSFDRVGFVGYTATPFANIFIGVDINDTDCGPDLFPRSFIVSLKTPSDYIGPAMVFGNPGDEAAGIPEQSPLPMFVPIDDAAAWLPDKHDKSQMPGPLPSSLRNALRLFALVCAARACRGDADVHNSMLIHATRFIDVQGRVADQVEKELVILRNIISTGSGENANQLRSEMEKVWRDLIKAKHRYFKERLGERCADFSLILTGVTERSLTW
jgi:hypothetical protein